jgi:uncharacterized protein (TIGR02246 family)
MSNEAIFEVIEDGMRRDEDAIRQLMDDSANAVRSKDVEALMSNFAPDVLSFDVVNPLQYRGTDAARARAEEWFGSFEGPIGYEVRDLAITTGADVAFCHSLNQVSATKKDGGKLEMWWRATVCLRKIEGNWKVTHQHNSVPFDPESGKASIDLKP